MVVVIYLQPGAVAVAVLHAPKAITKYRRDFERSQLSGLLPSIGEHFSNNKAIKEGRAKHYSWHWGAQLLVGEGGVRDLCCQQTSNDDRRRQRSSVVVGA